MSRHERSISRSRRTNTDGTEDSCDHAIHLVDTTKNAESLHETPSRSDSPLRKKLTRDGPRASVRDSLNRRKYAKWSQERFDTKTDDTTTFEEREVDNDDDPNLSQDVQKPRDSSVLDFAPQTKVDTTHGRQSGKKAHRRENHEEHVIDILYENQRGSFFCGIPLYSHSSLLNFDPGAWVTKEYKDSAVNITNAQVPDPSWQWDWKHWYVDMSGDVDEDGWQYSFAFFGNFAWHGTHPWFHSFVRRRRWLRRRVKKQAIRSGKPLPSSMSQAHKMNTDYFTIHSKRAQSPGRGLGSVPETARPESYTSYRSANTVDDEMPEDIKDIATLLKALRLSSVDREKIDAVKKFVNSGEEELVYLKEQIPDIMAVLVFQNSKRQVLEFMKQKATEAQQHRDEHDAEDRPEGEAESRRIENLLKAVEAADEQVRGLEYWSDRKHVLTMKDETKSMLDTPLKTIFDEPASSPRLESDPAGDIKGIADEAEIGTIVTNGLHKTDTNEAKSKEKGKAREQEDTKEEADDAKENEKRLSPRLGQDQMLIPDEDA